MRPACLGAALLIAGAASCRSDASQPGRELMPEMVASVPYDSFAPNPVTRDGKTLMAPPRGTIPRGRMPLRYGPGPEEALRAGRELANPVTSSPAVAARGEKLFRSFCVTCHGAAGEGDGPIIPLFPTPPSLAAEHARKLPDGQIFHIITHGQNAMPGHGSQIDPTDRWFLVHHVRTLGPPGGTLAEAASPAPAAPRVSP